MLLCALSMEIYFMEPALILIVILVFISSPVRQVTGFVLVREIFFPFFDSLSDMSNVTCLCKNCRLHRNSLQLDKDTLTFNLFQIDLDSDNNNNNIFDDSMSNVLSAAYNILNSCNYHSIQAMSQQDIGSSLSTFYFHNIDGYKLIFMNLLQI